MNYVAIFEKIKKIEDICVGIKNESNEEAIDEILKLLDGMKLYL